MARPELRVRTPRPALVTQVGARFAMAESKGRCVCVEQGTLMMLTAFILALCGVS
jgi:hypothetical protein